MNFVFLDIEFWELKLKLMAWLLSTHLNTLGYISNLDGHIFTTFLKLNHYQISLSLFLWNNLIPGIDKKTQKLI